MSEFSLQELLRRAAAKGPPRPRATARGSGRVPGAFPGSIPGAVLGAIPGAIPGAGRGPGGMGCGGGSGGDGWAGIPGAVRPRWAAVRVEPGKRGRVLRWFSAAILRGELVVGETLPGERKLAAALGVSRDTVRAAMDELAAGGWVEPRGQRHGRGRKVLRVVEVKEQD